MKKIFICSQAISGLMLLGYNSFALADRITGSQYMDAKILSIQKCTYTNKVLNSIGLSIQDNQNRVIEIHLNSHTKYTHKNMIKKCEDLKVNQNIKLGYASGNDNAQSNDHYLIIDSIEIK